MYPKYKSKEEVQRKKAFLKRKNRAQLNSSSLAQSSTSMSDSTNLFSSLLDTSLLSTSSIEQISEKIEVETEIAPIEQINEKIDVETEIAPNEQISEKMEVETEIAPNEQISEKMEVETEIVPNEQITEKIEVETEIAPIKQFIEKMEVDVEITSTKIDTLIYQVKNVDEEVVSMILQELVNEQNNIRINHHPVIIAEDTNVKPLILSVLHERGALNLRTAIYCQEIILTVVYGKINIIIGPKFEEYQIYNKWYTIINKCLYELEKENLVGSGLRNKHDCYRVWYAI